jgi:phospholipid/cholesterol/gamma-HCH transport system ATP-binding protein
MIRVVAIDKAFNGTPVLEGISLQVRRGQFAALIGRSGHGKSVLLRHLAGMLRPDRGQVLVDGEDLAQLGARALRRLRRRFGFVFQGGALFDSMSVFDNVAFPLRECLRLPEPEVRSRAEAALAQVGLAAAAAKLPGQISGGMGKRAALARALVLQPEILFFDEPTTGLDPITAQSILALIARCHRDLGFTGVIVSHQIPQVFEIVQQVVVLHRGRLRFDGTPDALRVSQDEVVMGLLGADDLPVSETPPAGPASREDGV